MMKEQILYYTTMGHDIRFILESVVPALPITNFPDEFNELLQEQIDNGEREGNVAMEIHNQDGASLEVHGTWQIIIKPEDLRGQLDRIKKEAVGFILDTIKPGVIWNWPDETNEVEWETNNDGIHTGHLDCIINKGGLEFIFSIKDLADDQWKRVTLSDLTMDSLIYVAEVINSQYLSKSSISSVDFKQKDSTPKKEEAAETKPMYRCEECGSTDVQIKAWYDPNKGEYRGDCEEFDKSYCTICDCYVTVGSADSLMDDINDWFENDLEPDDPEVITGLCDDDYDSEEEYDAACKAVWDAMSDEEKIEVWRTITRREK